MAIPQYVVIGYSGTHASISGLSGWSRYTAADGRHIKSIPTSSTAPGTTGGSAQHHHTTSDHTHTLSHTHATANTAASAGTVAVASAGSVDTNQNAHVHATGIISASTGTTEATNHPDSGDASSTNDPVRYDTIFLQSDGTPTSIPEGGITFFNNATLPVNWTQPANGKLKFLRGAAAAGNGGGTGGGASHTHAGGAHTHTSDHVHPNATGAAVATNTSESVGTLAAADDHTHVITVTSGNFGSSSSNAYNTSGTTTPDNPPWIKLAVITPPAGGDAVKSGLIALWFESIASIPGPDWVLCNGANGTPDLCQGLFVMGCDALSELLNTGGTATHTHTAGTAHGHTFTNTHTHVLTVAAGASARGVTGSTSTQAAVGHTHANSNSGAANTLTVGTASPNPSMLAADHSPLYIEAAFIQNKAATPISVPVPADAWETLADSTPTIDKQDLGVLTPKTATPPADAWGNLADSIIAGIPRRGWIDSVVYDEQAAEAGTTPKPVNVPADAWATLADAPPTISERGFLTVTLTDPWLNLGDSTPTIDERGFLRITVPTDAWANLTDATPLIDQRGFLTSNVPADANAAYAERVGLGIALTGDGMTMADQTPTVTKSIVTTLIPVNVPADAWGTLADQTPLFDKPVITTTPINAPVPGDSLGLYADTTPIIDERGFIGVLLPTDANVAYTERLGLGIALFGDSMVLNDQAPTIDERGYLSAAPAPDLNAAYSEQLGLGIGLLGDSMAIADAPPTISKVDLGTTLIPVNVSGDSLLNWADAPPTTERRRLGWQDQVAYNRPINNQVGVPVPADSLGLYADTTPLLFIRYLAGYALFLVDESGNYIVDDFGNPFVIAGLVDTLNQFVDSVTLDRQSIGLTPKTANVPADAWANLADQTPTISERGNYAILLTGDSMAMGDTTPIVGMTGRILINLSADNLNQWQDSRDATTTGLVPKSYNIPADDFASYAEQFGLGLSLRGDSMPMADQPVTVALTGRLIAAPSADAMTMGDVTPTVALTTLKTAIPAPDANAAYGERLGQGRGFSDDLANYAERFGLGIQFIDANVDYVDQIQVTTGGNYRINIAADSLQFWTDTPPAQQYGKVYAVPADGMVMGDTTPTYTIGKLYTVSDSLPAYSEIFGRGVGVIDSPTAYLDSAAATEFGLLLAIIADQNEDYLDAINILYLGFDQLAAILSDSMVNWDDALAIVRHVYGLHLHGKLIDDIKLHGKVIEQLSLNGRSGEELDVSGKTFTGEV